MDVLLPFHAEINEQILMKLNGDIIQDIFIKTLNSTSIEAAGKASAYNKIK